MKKVAPALAEVGAAVAMILERRQQVRELNKMVKDRSAQRVDAIPALQDRLYAQVKDNECKYCPSPPRSLKVSRAVKAPSCAQKELPISISKLDISSTPLNNIQASCRWSIG